MKRILLAEDEEILRMLIRDTLEDQNFLMDEAADGQEAIQHLEENAYDLVILDHMMPVYTGLEVIQLLRQSLKKTELKVMMLSAKSGQEEREKAIQTGADYFMPKPFSPGELLTKIKEILNEA